MSTRWSSIPGIISLVLGTQILVPSTTPACQQISGSRWSLMDILDPSLVPRSDHNLLLSLNRSLVQRDLWGVKSPTVHGLQCGLCCGLYCDIQVSALLDPVWALVWAPVWLQWGGANMDSSTDLKPCSELVLCLNGASQGFFCDSSEWTHWLQGKLSRLDCTQSFIESNSASQRHLASPRSLGIF